MCHKEIAVKICSEKCQDTARRKIHRRKILGEIWAKSSRKSEGLLIERARIIVT
jgi:hypothetical protein